MNQIGLVSEILVFQDFLFQYKVKLFYVFCFVPTFCNYSVSLVSLVTLYWQVLQTNIYQSIDVQSNTHFFPNKPICCQQNEMSPPLQV